MRGFILNRFVLFTVALLIFSACASKRAIKIAAPVDPFPAGMPEKVEEKQLATFTSGVIDSLNQRQPQFTSLSLKAKGDILVNGKDNDVTLNIRIAKDRAIWVSVTATIANLEISRAMITPDSIRLINRATEEYLQKPFSYLAQYAGEGISFGILQSLITAATLPGTPGQASIEKKNGNTLFMGQLNQLAYLLTADQDLRIIQTDLKNPVTAQLLRATYTDFTIENGQLLPNTVTMRSASKLDDISLTLKYSKMIVNEPVEMPFNVPKKFTRIDE